MFEQHHTHHKQWQVCGRRNWCRRAASPLGNPARFNVSVASTSRWAPWLTVETCELPSPRPVDDQTSGPLAVQCGTTRQVDGPHVQRCANLLCELDLELPQFVQATD